MIEFTDCELVIMQVLWREGGVTAQQIEKALSHRFANSTVRTFLRILEGKGHVAHRRNGRSFVFEALTTHDQAAREAFELLVERFFEGSAQRFQEWVGSPVLRTSRAKRDDKAGAAATQDKVGKSAVPSATGPTNQDVWLL